MKKAHSSAQKKKVRSYRKRIYFLFKGEGPATLGGAGTGMAKVRGFSFLSGARVRCAQSPQATFEGVNDVPPAPKPLFQLLDELLDRQGSLSIGVLLDKAGEQSFGLAILLLSLVAYVPGIANLAALVAMAVGWQLFRGWPHPWLPERLQRHELHHGRIKESLARLEKLLNRLGPRTPSLKPVSRQAVGLAVLWLAFLAALPMGLLPFANVLPAVGLSLLGIALLEERQGLAYLGYGTALLTTAYFVFFFWGGERTFQWILHRWF